jgi:hypothetical protein
LSEKGNIIFVEISKTSSAKFLNFCNFHLLLHNSFLEQSNNLEFNRIAVEPAFYDLSRHLKNLAKEDL